MSKAWEQTIRCRKFLFNLTDAAAVQAVGQVISQRSRLFTLCFLLTYMYNMLLAYFYQCFGTGFQWVSGSGTRQAIIVPKKKKEEPYLLSSLLGWILFLKLVCPYSFVGFKKTLMTVFGQIYFSLSLSLASVRIPDWASAWSRIRIQQNVWIQIWI